MNTNIRANFIIYLSNLFKKILILILISIFLIFILLHIFNLSYSPTKNISYLLDQNNAMFQQDFIHYDYILTNMQKKLTSLLHMKNDDVYHKQILDYQTFFDFNLLYLELDDPNFQAYYSLIDHQTSSIDDSYYFIYPIHQQNKQLYAILVYPYKFNNHLNAFDFHYLISTDQNAITNYAKQYYNLSPLTLQSNNNQTFYFYSMLEMNVYYRLFYQKIIEYLLFFLITFFYSFVYELLLHH